MHEAPLTDVDASVADLAAATGGKEHQITTAQGITAYGRRAHADQFARRPRQLDARRITVDVTNQAAAIEAAGWGIAAVAVRRADKAQCTKQYIVSAP